MKNIKPTVAKNLAALRKEKGITQSELAEKLNYSDKAISRWEHGDTLPDINVLYELCEFYGVTLDYLVQEGTTVDKENFKTGHTMVYRGWVCALAVAIVWLVATLVFVYSKATLWTVFIWALPVSCLTLSYMTRGMRTRIFTLILNTALNWTLLTAVYLQFLSNNFWLIFILGIPLQVIAVLWYKIKQFR